jgi:CRISPR-associated protein Cas2
MVDMYVIMVYDIGEERVSRVLRIGRQYLAWIQNSVFEGEISEADLMKLKNLLLEVIDVERDSVTFYLLRTTTYLKKETLGRIKGEPTKFL